jgi:hypothetical protein
MNTQLAEELRSSMEQFTEHVVMPSGLARRAYRRWRKRRVMARAASAAAAAAAVGAAIAVTGGGGGGAQAHGRAQARDAAYVITHVENALTTVGRGNSIFFSSTTTTGWGAGYTRAWDTRDRFNEMEYTSSGHLQFSLTVTRVPGGLQELVVQYLHQMVGHQLVTGTGTARGCSTAAGILETLDLNPNDMTNWPATIRALVGCKLITVARHQRAGGAGLIRFVQPHVAGFPFSMALLVNPSTFLPSRMVVTSSAPGQKWESTTEFGSLPPTRANLAHLTAPVPAGFTQVHSPPETASSSTFGNETAWMFGQ